MFDLYEHQRRDIVSLRDAFREARSVCYVAPTGSGKTVTFARITAQARGKKKRVLILVHRDFLLDQVSRALQIENVEHQVIDASHRGYDHAIGCYVASVFTLAKRQFPLAPDLIVIDEAHHTAAGSWKTVLGLYPEAETKILGVTATPCRLDGAPLSMFQRLVLAPDVEELTRRGILCPAKYFTSGQKVILDDKALVGGDYSAAELEKVEGNRAIVGDAIKNYQEHADQQPAIAFCISVEHAKTVAEDFRAAGYTSEALYGTMKKSDRDAVMNRFRSGITTVLTSCDLVSEGFDLPGLFCAILLRPTASLSMYLQMIGRVLRSMAGKVWAVIIDHVGNVDRHGWASDKREWSLEGEGKRREPDPYKRCPACYEMVKVFKKFCPNCGHEFVTKGREIEIIDGQLVEMKISPKDRRRIRAKNVLVQALLKYTREIRMMRREDLPGNWVRAVLSNVTADNINIAQNAVGLFSNEDPGQITALWYFFDPHDYEKTQSS